VTVAPSGKPHPTTTSSASGALDPGALDRVPQHVRGERDPVRWFNAPRAARAIPFGNTRQRRHLSWSFSSTRKLTALIALLNLGIRGLHLRRCCVMHDHAARRVIRTVTPRRWQGSTRASSFECAYHDDLYVHGIHGVVPRLRRHPASAPSSPRTSIQAVVDARRASSFADRRRHLQAEVDNLSRDTSR